MHERRRSVYVHISDEPFHEVGTEWGWDVTFQTTSAVPYSGKLKEHHYVMIAPLPE